VNRLRRKISAVGSALIVGVFAALAAADATAQSAPFVESSIVSFSQLASDEYRWTVRFRNTSTDRTSLFGIGGYSLAASERLRSAFRSDWSGFGYLQQNAVRVVGNVDQRNFTPPLVPNAIRGVTYAFDAGWHFSYIYNFSDINAYLWGPWSSGSGGSSSMGLLGCAIPLDLARDGGPAFAGASHAGRTCVADGYDGWREFDFTIRTSRLSLTSEDLSFDFIAAQLRGPTITPEPSTVALMGFGLATLMLVARRRFVRPSAMTSLADPTEAL